MIKDTTPSTDTHVIISDWIKPIYIKRAEVKEETRHDDD